MTDAVTETNNCKKIGDGCISDQLVHAKRQELSSPTVTVSEIHPFPRG